MWGNLAWVLWLAIAALAPFLAGQYLLYNIGIVATTAAIVSGLTFLSGVAGLISIAQSAFVAIGSYGAVLLQMHLGIPLLIGIPVAAAIAGVVGWLLGFLCLRLDGHYLALVTLAFMGIVHYTIINLDITGGAVGLAVPSVALFGVTLDSPMAIYVMAVTASAVTLWSIDRLIHSRYGRMLRALRQSDIAAVSLGADRRSLRTMALATSAVAGGFAGGFQALQLTYLDPQQFTIVTAVFYIAIMVVGGMRSVHGAIIGAAIFVFVPGFLSGLEHYMAFILFFFVTVMIVVMPDGLVSIFSAGGRLSGWMASRHGRKNA